MRVLELSPEWKEIEAKERVFFTQIQTLVKEQRELWQKIPALAWTADQLKGRYDNTLYYGKAARFGLWPICHTNSRFYADFWIDCESGLILNPRSLLEVEPVELRPLLGHLVELNPLGVRQSIEHYICSNTSISTKLPPCPVPDPFKRTKPLPEAVDTQIVESSD